MIEILSIDHYTQILDLWHLTGLPFKERGRDSYLSLEKQLKAGSIVILGYFSDQTLVGVVLLSQDGRKGWINRLAVHPLYQRRGIASKLIQYCENYFRSLNITVYGALIEADNIQSKNCFEKNGWSYWPEIHYYSKRESDQS